MCLSNISDHYDRWFSIFTSDLTGFLFTEIGTGQKERDLPMTILPSCNSPENNQIHLKGK